MRVHDRQIVNFRSGRGYTTHGNPEKGKPRSKWLKKLGPKDELAEWVKPKDCNLWMSTEQFLTLPRSIVLRELCYQLTQPGFRSRKIILVTTLLSAEDYSAQALAKLYGIRWSTETGEDQFPIRFTAVLST